MYCAKIILKTSNAIEFAYVSKKIRSVSNNISLYSIDIKTKKSINKYITLYKSPFVYKKAKSIYAKKEMFYSAYIALSTYMEAKLLVQIIENLSKKVNISIKLISAQ